MFTQEKGKQAIRFEIEASWFYLSLSAWAKLKGLRYLESWAAFEAEEEIGHAKKMCDTLDLLFDLKYEISPEGSSETYTFKGIENALEQALKMETFLLKWYSKTLNDAEAPASVLLLPFVQIQLDSKLTLQRKLAAIDKAADELTVEQYLFNSQPVQGAC